MPAVLHGVARGIGYPKYFNFDVPLISVRRTGPQKYGRLSAFCLNASMTKWCIPRCNVLPQAGVQNRWLFMISSYRCGEQAPEGQVYYPIAFKMSLYRSFAYHVAMCYTEHWLSKILPF